MEETRKSKMLVVRVENIMLAIISIVKNVKTGETISREVVGPAPPGKDPYKELAAELAEQYMQEHST